MLSIPLSRKNSIALAAVGVVIVAALCFAAVQNAHANSASVSGSNKGQAKLDQNAQVQTAAVPNSISQTQSVTAGSTNNASDQSSVTSSGTVSSSSNSQSDQPTNPSYTKPGGIEPADGNIPDPDTYKPLPPIVYPGGPIVVPDPTHPICHLPQIMPANGILPKCGNPYPIPPCRPVEPGVMIACPIAYRAE